VVPQSHYSPDLSPADFLFSKLKVSLNMLEKRVLRKVFEEKGTNRELKRIP